MSIRKSDDAIEAELTLLRALKNRVIRRNAFGDDHHAAIEAQCAVLEKRMSLSSIYKTYGNEDDEDFAENVLDDALTANYWMNGELTHEEGSPSDAWAELAT